MVILYIVSMDLPCVLIRSWWISRRFYISKTANFPNCFDKLIKWFVFSSRSKKLAARMLTRSCLKVMHCALGRPFYGASKMAVTLGRKAPQSNQARIKVGFHFRHNKSSKTRSKQACGLFQKRAIQHAMKGKRLCFLI